ncbi:hypothetical protein B9Z55_016852 [Caenorhabditis nigoni]|uniref:Uncharacterized protein n=1 Tax=Caenorhabditis nigoni TaxID=1611254 RepID=A0A2G5T6Y8_9PELO|nr:hypothetical protein B9Z55_016852 [Caenorhabditis nigoni]
MVPPQDGQSYIPHSPTPTLSKRHIIFYPVFKFSSQHIFYLSKSSDLTDCKFLSDLSTFLCFNIKKHTVNKTHASFKGEIHKV